MRLDAALVEQGLVQSRQRARALILAGKVRVNQKAVSKAGTQVKAGDALQLVAPDMPYVSRGGLKLQAALEAFAVALENRVCMDVGASTGGFTDCLLQNGARRVYCIDVGYGQLAWPLRQDPRVVVLERTNIRYLDPDRIADPVDVATIDVSFISLKKVVPAVLPLLAETAEMVVLIKPQFEVGRQHVGKGGVVRDPTLHHQTCQHLQTFFESCGLKAQPVLPSPIKGPKGNAEFLMHLKAF